MFLKSFKYSIRSTFKALIIISISLVVAFIVLGVAVSLIANLQGEVSTLTGVVASTTVALTGLFVSSTPTVFLFYLIIATHRDFTSDKAYLTFTLPIEAKDLILSKALSIFAQMLILTVAQIIGVTIFILIISVSSGMPSGEIFSEIFNAFGLFEGMEFFNVNAVWNVLYIVEVFLSYLLSIAFGILLTIFVVLMALNDRKKLFKIIAIIVVAFILAGNLLVIGMTAVIEFIFNVNTVTSLTVQPILIIGLIILAALNIVTFVVCKNKIESGIELK